MIRKLGEKDRAELLQYVEREAALNLFIIGDVENFGFESDMQELWGDFREDGTYKGVLLRYKKSFIIYGQDGFDKKEFAEIVKSYEDAQMLSGKEETVEEMKEYLDYTKITVDYFAELKETAHESENEGKVQLGLPEDAEGIHKLLAGINEFSIKQTPEEIRANMVSGGGRTYIIKEDDNIAARAATTAENSKSAMIVGVCTNKDYRQKGYASACVSLLCKDLIKEGKTLCLFYDNPAAGRIYKRIGFQDIGKWTMMKLF